MRSVGDKTLLYRLAQYVLDGSHEEDNYMQWCKDNDKNPLMLEHNLDHIYPLAIVAHSKCSSGFGPMNEAREDILDRVGIEEVYKFLKETKDERYIENFLDRFNDLGEEDVKSEDYKKYKSFIIDNNLESGSFSK